jgi:hypothetical protein
MLGFVFLYPPTALCYAIHRALEKGALADGMKHVLFCSPIINTYYAQVQLFGSARVYPASVLLFLAAIVFKVLCNILFWSSLLFTLIGTSLVLLGVVAFWLGSAWSYLRIAIILRQSVLVKAACVILPPGGAYLLASRVGKYIREHEDEIMGTFDQ